MTGNGRIVAAVVGSYLLGRTKKARLAIGLGMVLAGRKLSLQPQEWGRLALSSPVMEGLSEQVRKELFEGVKAAATSALTHRASSLADSLRERSQSLSNAGAEGDVEPDEAEDRDEESLEESDASNRRTATRAPSKRIAARKKAVPRPKASAGAGNATPRTAKKAGTRGGRSA